MGQVESQPTSPLGDVTPAGCQSRLLRFALWFAVISLVVYFIYEVGPNLKFDNRYDFGFDALGTTAFVLTASVLWSIVRRNAKQRLIKLFTLCIFYVGSYGVMSAGGEYYFSQSGTLRYSFGLSVSDVSIWYPKYLYWEPFKNIDGKQTSRGTNLGYYFAPLIMIDRAWLHPTEYLFTDDSADPDASL